jgi:hypothetical protein
MDRQTAAEARGSVERIRVGSSIMGTTVARLGISRQPAPAHAKPA